tara:strand:- start:348 stop:1313 length:966 start_codon:yes stop_codon:yes gene_type:complete
MRLDKENNLSIYPIQDKNIWDMYKKAVAVFWTVEEIDFTKDRKYYEMLNDEEKHFIKMILCFFAGADALVNNNILERFMREINNPEILCFYSFQMAIECIHQETYSLMIDNLIKNSKEKDLCFNAIKEIPTIKQKAEWCNKYTNSFEPLSKRLVAFAIVEGIFFSGAFASIYWLKAYKQDKAITGLCFSNELISRDEALHTEFAVYLYNKLDEKLFEYEINDMFEDAVRIETDFINNALPCKLIGMNADSMTSYIKFVADRLLVQLGHSKLYNVSNPFNFMEMISIEGKTNFFEKRVGEYSRSSAFGLDDEVDAFAFNTSF